MTLWLETVGVCGIAVGGIGLALWLAKLPKGYWMAAYCAGLLVVVLFGLQRFVLGLEFYPPFSWLAAGRTKFILAALIVPVLILT